MILGQLVILTSCLSNLETETSNGNTDDITVWQYSSFAFFDTVSFVYSYKGDSQESFNANCEAVFKVLEKYHQLCDIYNEYTGIVNLCTINKNAGKEALEVDQELIDFLLYAKQIYNITSGETNIMLGSVLKLWHDARTTASNAPNEAYIPKLEHLEEANKSTSIDLLEIDDEKNTVRISSPNGRIDVGALAKGYATEKAAKLLELRQCYGYVLNIGGNIRIVGTKLDGSGWNTGIKNPIGYPTYSLYINISDTSCVTSGDYERYFVFEGKRYHHIIDKDTMMPAQYFSSVTILAKDSGLADALSTALFTMPYEDGRKLVDSLENVEAIWIYSDGTVIYTDGIHPIEI